MQKILLNCLKMKTINIKNNESTIMAISNCFFSLTSENPWRFSVWCALAKFKAHPNNYS